MESNPGAGAVPFEPIPKEPTRLVNFLRSKGGIKDVGGNLNAMLGGAKGRPGLINNKIGLELDYAREAAVEGGYLPPDAEINTLLDAIHDDLHGTPRYSEQHGQAVDAFNYAIERNAEIERIGQEMNIPTHDVDRKSVV